MKTTKRLKKHKDIDTAYHEAGYAVACFIQKKAFEYVTIIPNEKKKTLGHVTLTRLRMLTEEDDERSSRIRDKIEKSVKIFLAGPLAEGKYLNKMIGFPGGVSDLNYVMSAISTQCSSQWETVAYLKFLTIRTEQLWEYSTGVNTPYWKAVVALADELVVRKEIKYYKCRQIINDSLKQRR